jgi:hypothetical protein
MVHPAQDLRIVVLGCLSQNVQGPEYLKKNLLTGLPDLGNRVLEIRQGKAATSAAENDRQLQQSQVSSRIRASRSRLKMKTT